MAFLRDKGNYFELKGSGCFLRISKNNGVVTDPTATLVKSDVRIAISALIAAGQKALAEKVASRYKGKFD